MTTIEADVTKWAAWRPEEVARLLEGVEAPWYVAAGWAIDLFLGGQRREHRDLEIAVPSDRFGEIADALADHELFAIFGPHEAVPLPDVGDRLAQSHQTWVRDPLTGQWRLDVFREPSEGDTWICRRNAAIRLPYSELIETTADGLPYGRPEVILLFKAKRPDEERNRQDLAAVLPSLEPERTRWLREALEHVHPGHPWLAELSGA
jgi:hypothetical protein